MAKYILMLNHRPSRDLSSAPFDLDYKVLATASQLLLCCRYN